MVDVLTYRLDIQLPADVQYLRLHSKLEVGGGLVRVVDADKAGGRPNDRAAAVLIVVGDHVDAELVGLISGTLTVPIRISELPGHAWLVRILKNEITYAAWHISYNCQIFQVSIGI